jgi:superfamily I DNA/RNA helicase
MLGDRQLVTHQVTTKVFARRHGWVGVPELVGDRRVLTAHKAQGSEWDRVLVVVDLDDLERVTGTSKAAQWLYTAVTRARHQVAIADLSQISGLG